MQEKCRKLKKNNILITGITSKNVIVYLYTTKLKNFGTEWGNIVIQYTNCFTDWFNSYLLLFYCQSHHNAPSEAPVALHTTLYNSRALYQLYHPSDLANYLCIAHPAL